MGFLKPVTASLPKSHKLSDEAVLALIENRRQLIRILGFAVCLVFLAVPVGACYPIAKTIAGTQTDFNVTVSLAYSVAASLTTGGAVWWGTGHRRRANEAERRAIDLENRLKVQGAKP